jgi:hypothetical protein
MQPDMDAIVEKMRGPPVHGETGKSRREQEYPEPKQHGRCLPLGNAAVKWPPPAA